MFHRYCIRGALAALFFAPGVTGATGIAAQTGAVTGTVTDAGTSQPLAEVSVSLAGTETSGLTNLGGRYRLDGVPAGTYTLRVAIPGYRSREKEVTVSAGDTRVADFQLEVSGLHLGQVVRGGMTGPVERRSRGATSPALDAVRVAEFHPVESFSQLLEGRIPGVRSVGTNGAVGAERELVIRGIDSFGHTRQRPLVYVDGIRVDNMEQAEWFLLTDIMCCRFYGGAGEDRLSDLNPGEIDRVEVLKGPAAATLYGVEGSAGVIEVFTKQGRGNTPATFTLNAGLGFHRLRPNLPTTLRPNIGRLDGNGQLVFPAWDPNETLIENGLINSYDLTVFGGGEDLTYFVSGGLTREEGSIKPNDQNRANVRVNLRWKVAERNLILGVTTAHARNRIVLESGGGWLGVYTNAMLSDPRQASEDEPYGGGLGGSVAATQAIEAFSHTDRWTAGIRIEHNPRPNFTHRLTVGVDLVGEEKSRRLPWGHRYAHLGSEGEKSLTHRRSRKTTVGYRMTYGYADLFGLAFLSGSLVAGAQLDRDSVGASMSVVRGYRPGWYVGGEVTTFADAGFSEQANLGTFVQNRFDLTPNLSLTAAVRFDANSSFEFDPGWMSYPKAALSYDLPRSFLPAAISTLRVRAAGGKAGKLLPPFYGLPPWERTVVLGNKPGMRYTRRFVYTDIGPENKREVEAGLDVGLLDDRIGVELTYYDARTANALLLLPIPASRGGGAFSDNCCEIVNRGFEASLAASLVDLPSFRWKLDLAYEWNSNRITNLGPYAADDSIPRYRRKEDGTWELVRWDRARSLDGWFEGQSVGDILSFGIAGYDPATNTHRATDFRFNRGKARPIHMGSVFNSFRLGGSLRLSFQLRGEMGAVMRNSGRTHGVRVHAHDEYLRHLDDNGEPTYKADSVFDFHRIEVVDKRDHIRLQEVALSYFVPQGIGNRLGLPGTTVTLSAYNLHWWDDCNCPDPSLTYLHGDLEGLPFMALPQPRRFLLSVRTRF